MTAEHLIAAPTSEHGPEMGAFATAMACIIRADEAAAAAHERELLNVTAIAKTFADVCCAIHALQCGQPATALETLLRAKDVLREARPELEDIWEDMT